MCTDIVTAYEGTILKNLIVTKKWFNVMVQKWLEHPHLLLTEKKLQKKSNKHNCWGVLSE
ncbi:hypothetical protein J2Y67_002322 [Neobacillus niacini]|nr:hypothetical protein [Neobacillus niacini]